MVSLYMCACPKSKLLTLARGTVRSNAHFYNSSVHASAGLEFHRSHYVNSINLPFLSTARLMVILVPEVIPVHWDQLGRAIQF